MRAALILESLKFRRSCPALVATLLLSFILPMLCIGLMAMSSKQSADVMSMKLSALLLGEEWQGAAGFLGQLYSVAFLLAAGFVACWSFGREFTDRKVGSYFGINTPRSSIVLAKCGIISVWGVSTACIAAVVLLSAGLLNGYGWPNQADIAVILKTVAIGISMTLLALPFCAIATLTRGYLGSIGILIGLIAVTEISVILGAGAWFPYATMGMWSGLGGIELRDLVMPIQLLFPVPIAAASVLLTSVLWERLGR